MPYTTELKPNELKALDIFKEVFTGTFNGLKSAVKTHTLVAHIAYHYQLKINARSVRKLVGILRRSDDLKPGFILSDVDHGYWYSTDKAEQKKYLNQQLDRMANQFENIKELHARLSLNAPENQIQLSLLP